jgi:DNA-binding MarR family transcriptional regulator
MKEEIDRRLNAPDLGPCICSQVRKLARKLSSLYDTVLAPEKLTITQYALLANIARAGPLRHTVLAKRVGMERTTLTRNLCPLTQGKLVAATAGLDRRQRLLQLTTAGRRKLIRCLPLWEEAQHRFLSHIGSEPMQDLRMLLGSAESAVTKALNSPSGNRESTRLNGT